MTEQEYQREAESFVKRLKHFPRVGQRPYGYPRSAWWFSGAMGFVGLILQLPLQLLAFDRTTVLFSVAGAFLMGCGFTMRMVAFTSAAGGAMDRWLHEQILEARKSPGAGRPDAPNP